MARAYLRPIQRPSYATRPVVAYRHLITCPARTSRVHLYARMSNLQHVRNAPNTDLRALEYHVPRTSAPAHLELKVELCSPR